MSVNRELVLILDFGSQYTQLIARRVREQQGLLARSIRSTCRSSASARCARRRSSSRAARRRCTTRARRRSSPELFDLGVPILGICYGVQLTGQLLGGKVVAGRHSASTAAPTCSVDAAGVGAVPRLHRGRGARGLDVATAIASRRCRTGFALVGESAELRPSPRSPTRAAQVLRRAVPPRGRAHAARRRDPGATSCSASAAASRAGPWPASSTRRWRTIRAQVGASGRVDLRPVGRRRLVGGGGAGPPRDRRPADLHLRRQRPAARRASAAQVEALFRGAFKADLRVVDAERALPGQAGRRHRSRAEAQDHRPRVHRRVRGGGASASAAPSSWRRARSTPTSSRASRCKGPSAHDQDATTTWAACPSA